MTNSSLRSKDLCHLWHPFTDTPVLEQSDFPIIERGEGIYLFDDQQNTYIDGICSWWCTNLGHNHKALLEALHSQSALLQHSMLGEMSHPTAILLAEKLASITPDPLTRSLFASDGACAVEAALKIAVQYWANIGKNEKNGFVSVQGAYHGDTLGTMGLGFMPSFHKDFSGNVIQAFQAMQPSDREESIQSVEAIFREHHKTIAAIAIEPLCQGAAGMHFYPASYLRQLRELCDRYQVLLIADEIAVGLGRLGTLTACEQADICPDILCLGKALTGGYLPLSVTMTTESIYQSFRSKPLLHGHTFCGNPLSCALALAAVQIYEHILEQVTTNSTVLSEGLRYFEQFEEVSNIRSHGMIGAMDMRSSNEAKQLSLVAQKKGLLIRPLHNVIYLCPPLISTQEQLYDMITIIIDAFHEIKMKD